jgi:hypothetical protein
MLNVKPVEEFHSGGGSQSFATPTEQIRTNLVNNDVPPELMDELRANLNGMRGADTKMATPGNSGTDIISTSLLLSHFSSS